MPDATARGLCQILRITVLLLALTCIRAAHAQTNSALPAADAVRSEILTVAVLEFDSPYKVLRHNVSDLLRAELSAQPDLMLVERAQLKQILGEQALGSAGMVSPETAARIGQLTGAKVLVTGRVFRANKQLVLNSRVIGTESARVFIHTVQGDNTNQVALASELATKSNRPFPNSAPPS